MKKIFPIIIVCLFTLWNSKAQERILFIGNSMTMYNNMPQMVQNIAESKGKQIEIEQFTIGGQGLAQLTANPSLYEKIHSKNWTAVVIQPGTNESGNQVPLSQVASNTQKIIDSVKVHSPCARHYYYEISNGIPYLNGQADYDLYFQTQTLIKNTITALSQMVQIPFIPAGEAARTHYTNSQDLLLHNSYMDVHPNTKGSYLVACAVYSTIYQEKAYPSTYILSNMTESQAHYLQNLSDSVVFSTPTQWQIGVHQPNVFFEEQVTGATVELTNLSSMYDSLQWDINGEYTTTNTNTQYTFDTTGEKTITLTIQKENCSYTLSKKINIISLDQQKFEENTIQVYPNPFTEQLYLHNHHEIDKIILYDNLGRKILEQKHPETAIHFPKHLSSGNYILHLISKENKTKQIKVIKK